MRPRAVSIAGWLLLILGIVELAVFLFLRIGQATSPAMAEALRANSAGPMSYAMVGINGLAYAVFGLGLLKKQGWSFWCYVVYVPVVQLFFGASLGVGTVVELVIYACLVVLLVLPLSRAYLFPRRVGAAT